MSLQGKSLEDIREADLQALITNGEREKQTLEYKRDPYGRGDEPVREMLRDISSMANAFGGDLLLGVEEDADGVAIALPGVENCETEAQRIVNSCLSNIDERIPGLATWPIPLSNSRHVIVVRIPRSLRAPHMVTFKGLNQFWIRHDRQKSPMSIHEVRDACLRVEGLMERLERFLEKRRAEILNEMRENPYYLVSLTPIFVNTEVVNIHDNVLRNLLENPPAQASGWPVRFHHTAIQPTLHGLTLDTPNWKRVELLRNGHLELRVSCEHLLHRDSIQIRSQQCRLFRVRPIIECPVRLFRLGKAIYSHLGITDPLVVSISLYNIGGLALPEEPVESAFLHTLPGHEPRPWPEKHLEIPPRQVPSLDRPDRVAKESMDRLWQAFNFEGAPLFDDEGNFRLE